MQDRYDHPEYRRGYDRHSYGPRGYEMGPGWGWQGGDPNYRDGHYHGLRMRGDGRHVADYGRYRFFHQYDLGASGGFDGRNDLPDGWWDRRGYYHEQFERGDGRFEPRYVPAPPREDGPRMESGGGVHYDREYLRQYNAYSPGLREGRGWGYAPGPDAPSMRGEDARGRRTDERGHVGYNRGGFAEGKFPGPGTRDSIPTQKGGR
jgi:hypothetical protein